MKNGICIKLKSKQKFSIIEIKDYKFDDNFLIVLEKYGAIMYYKIDDILSITIDSYSSFKILKEKQLKGIKNEKIRN